jgi:hypothetical protein
MSNGTNDSELRSRYEINSARAERLALLILVGLVVEIASVFILKKSCLEGALTIVATSLILAGVWGELLFERRAKEAGDGLVARANARAAEAQLELARITTPRFRLLTVEAVTSIVEKIEPFRDTKFDVGHEPIGREQWDLAWQLEPIFPKAGWVFVDWIGGKTFSKLNWTMHPHTYGVANVSNVSIELSPEHREKLLPAANALAEALNGIGIATTVEANPISGTSITPDAIHLLIGTKE